MILPIYTHGAPVLRRVAKDISSDYPNLTKIIADMRETMYHADGVGLAAPQVGLSIRILIIDGSGFSSEANEGEELKRLMINPHIVSYGDEKVTMEEGCLSVPNIRAAVNRPDKITVTYQDEQFKEHTETFQEIMARIVQHEYDHLEGKIFVDHLSPLQKRRLQKKLNMIAKGRMETAYEVVQK